MTERIFSNEDTPPQDAARDVQNTDSPPGKDANYAELDIPHTSSKPKLNTTNEADNANRTAVHNIPKATTADSIASHSPKSVKRVRFAHYSEKLIEQLGIGTARYGVSTGIEPESTSTLQSEVFLIDFLTPNESVFDWKT